MTGIITVGNLTISGASRKIIYNKVARTGTLSVWDASSALSWPSQLAPTASVHSWLNIITGGIIADLPTTWTWNASGGFIRPGVGNSSINLGAPDLTNKDVTLMAWVKVPVVPTAFTPIIGRAQTTGAAVDNQFLLAIGADGKPRLDFMTSNTAVQTMTAASAITPGVHLFGAVFRRSAGQLFGDLYINNVQVGSGGIAGTGLNASTYNLALGDRRVGNSGGSTTAGYTYYRSFQEDNGVSTRNGADLIAAEWAAFNGKFT